MSWKFYVCGKASVLCGAAGVRLSEGQRTAVAQASVAPVMVLTGGPGCGKTFTTRTIVKLWRAMGKRCAMAAPTGAPRPALIRHRHASAPFGRVFCSHWPVCCAENLHAC